MRKLIFIFLFFCLFGFIFVTGSFAQQDLPEGTGGLYCHGESNHFTGWYNCAETYDFNTNHWTCSVEGPTSEYPSCHVDLIDGIYQCWCNWKFGDPCYGQTCSRWEFSNGGWDNLCTNHMIDPWYYDNGCLCNGCGGGWACSGPGCQADCGTYWCGQDNGCGEQCPPVDNVWRDVDPPNTRCYLGDRVCGGVGHWEKQQINHCANPIYRWIDNGGGACGACLECGPYGQQNCGDWTQTYDCQGPVSGCRECQTEQTCGTTNWDCSAPTCNECENCSPACGQAKDCGGYCLNTDDGAPAQVTGLSPCSVGTSFSGTVPLSWSIGDVKTDSYRAESYKTSTGVLEWSNNNITPRATTSINSSGYSAGNHYWRIRAVNASCGTDLGPWSGNCSFCYETLSCGGIFCGQSLDCSTCGVGDTGVPAGENIISPNGDAANPTVQPPSDNTIPLHWSLNTSLLTDQYEVVVENPATGVGWTTTTIGRGSTTVTTAALAFGTGNQNTYRWRVRAVNTTCSTIGVHTTYYGTWSVYGYFHLNRPPTFSSLLLKTTTNVNVPVEAGNRNQICQNDAGNTPYWANRNIYFEAAVADPDGASDLYSVTQDRVVLSWHGNSYNMNVNTTLGTGTTGTRVVDFNGVSDQGTYALDVTVTDIHGVSDSSPPPGRSLKVWDCNVPLSGTMYDSSSVGGNSVCSTAYGFNVLANADMNFMSVGVTQYVPRTDAVVPVTNPPGWTYTAPAGTIFWGRQYRLTPNSDIQASVINYRWVDVGVGPTTVSCNGSTNRVNNAVIDPYSLTPNLHVDMSMIQDQEPWYQVAGAGVMSRSMVVGMVPVTCELLGSAYCKWSITTDSINIGSINNGLVGAPEIRNSSGCPLGTCLGGIPNDWRYENNVINDPYNYQYFYDNYFFKQGLGVTFAVGTSMTNIVNAPVGGTGVVFVNGNLTVNTPTNSVPANNFLMVVVSGNIDILQGVTQAEGIFVADGNITAGGINATVLNINGLLYTSHSGQVVLSRGFVDKTFNNTYPGVVVNYQPKFLFSMPASLSKTITDWRITK